MKEKKLYLLLILTLLLTLLVSCDTPVGNTETDTDATSDESTENPDEDLSLEERFRNKMLEELNFARTTPSLYAEERLLTDYEKNTDNGSYLDLKNTSPVNAITLNQDLTEAADGYSKYLAVNNKWGHYENGSPSERCEAAGYDNFSGENIAAAGYFSHNIENDPENAAIEFILQWIIDEGVAGVGHRKNILSTSHNVVGIGYHYDSSSTYKNYSVQDFGSK